MALTRYGTISLTTPPAIEKATVASATPFARLAKGNISVGYTQLFALAHPPLRYILGAYQVVNQVLPYMKV